MSGVVRGGVVREWCNECCSEGVVCCEGCGGEGVV